MYFSNRWGNRVDPVPFFVVTGLAVMLLFSFGPLYGLAFGLSLTLTLTIATILSIAVTIWAYYWHVWNARPPGETSVGIRGERLFYEILVFIAIVIGLSLPLVLR